MIVTPHLLDMDGVLVRGMDPIPGSAEYLCLLRDHDIPFLVFSNNSRFTPAGLAERLSERGFPVTPEHIYTSAMTTAHFVHLQKPGARYFAIGEEGLTAAMNAKGFVQDDQNPDYVIVGESLDYSFEELAHGARLVSAGARFLGTNPDLTIPVEQGLNPACGAACALIEAASGRAPYFIGKPNPFMMRAALDKLGARAADTVMVGDRVDTDVIAGMELGLRTVLVLTGASSRETLDAYPYNPDLIVPSLFDLRHQIVSDT